MTKQQIRQNIRQYGHLITPQERFDAPKVIFDKIEQTDIFSTSQTIAIYASMHDEVATHDVIERWRKKGLRVVLPRISGDEMEFFDYSSELLQVGSFGILEPIGDSPVEPSDIDLMVLPGVAFCRDGRRLGRGRGFYDRYISRDGFRAFTIGVGFAHQLTHDIPCEPHDKVLDMVITPYVESPLTGIISHIIDSAGGDANRIGCGVERLMSMGMSWVLLRYKMELVRTPEADEPLSIETWISDCSRVVSSRNFRITDTAGEFVGEAISQWCMIDLNTRRPMDLTRSDINYPQFIKTRECSIAISGKLQPIDPQDSCIESYTHLATEADIDFNRHVNTFKYIEMMLRMLPHTALSHRGGVAIEIQFVHESYIDEQLTILHKREPEADDTSSTLDSIFEILRPQDSSHKDSTAVRARLKLYSDIREE